MYIDNVVFARAKYVVCMCVLLLYIANVASTIYFEPTIILSYVAAMENVDEIQTTNYTQAHSQTHNYWVIVHCKTYLF